MAAHPATGPLRVLLFSTLYPSGARPGHGLFVETRLRELLGSGRVQARVVAPVPWFPSSHPHFGARALMAATPRREQRHGIDVRHPRYALPPKVGQTVHPVLLALGARSALREAQREGFDFDLIDAHFYYPDGVAAALLARWLSKPLVITARGSDLNAFGRDAMARRMMRWAAGVAAASVGVSRALVEVLRGWGVPPERLHVIRNGVDTTRFAPQDQTTARAALGVGGEPLILSVGNLVPVKGHDLGLQALARLLSRRPGARLVVVGQGPELNALRAQAQVLGVAERVTYAGAVPQAQLPAWYSAADVLMLPSRSEGWANVLLESMACGTPVVATAVGGNAEVVADRRAGLVVPAGDPQALSDGLDALLSAPPDRTAVRAYAEGLGWDETTAAQLALFDRILAEATAGAAVPTS